MFKDTVTYTDYDGVERTETLYFNLSKPEVILMENSVGGGMSALLQRIVDSKDNPAIIDNFVELIKKSYGVKSDDGKRFIKSPQVTEEFMQSEAYTEFFMKLVTDADYAARFVNETMPKVENRQNFALDKG